MTVKPFFAPGHFHSPIVDPAKVAGHMKVARSIKPSDIQGIAIDTARMREIWLQNLDCIKASAFTSQAADGHRFKIGGPFPFGDALFLRMMVNAHKPKRIIEIGSGFSTACMLDAIDDFGLSTQVTCIEPNSARLRSLLKPTDSVEIIESEVQACDPAIVERLEAEDFLFIDSTHVMKTGSDVNFELFELLPRVKRGVLVHVHDCPYPFEYSPQWVLEKNLSWNEAYALRAFLMFNTSFSVEFWGSLFRRTFTDLLPAEFPDLLTQNPGTSIWLKRVA